MMKLHRSYFTSTSEMPACVDVRGLIGPMQWANLQSTLATVFRGQLADPGNLHRSLLHKDSNIPVAMLHTLYFAKQAPLPP